MVLSGFVTHSLMLSILTYLEQNYSSGLPETVRTLVTVAVTVIGILVSLGGITVAAGGVMLLVRHKLVGRTLIALGGGVGFLSLLIGLGYYSFANGTAEVLLHVEYWIGVVIAAVARWASKNA